MKSDVANLRMDEEEFIPGTVHPVILKVEVLSGQSMPPSLSRTLSSTTAIPRSRWPFELVAQAGVTVDCEHVFVSLSQVGPQAICW